MRYAPIVVAIIGGLVLTGLAAAIVGLVNRAINRAVRLPA